MGSGGQNIKWAELVLAKSVPCNTMGGTGQVANIYIANVNLLYDFFIWLFFNLRFCFSYSANPLSPQYVALTYFDKWMVAVGQLAFSNRKSDRRSGRHINSGKIDLLKNVTASGTWTCNSKHHPFEVWHISNVATKTCVEWEIFQMN